MTDPTLQTSGSLQAIFKLDWNSGAYDSSVPKQIYGMPVSFNSVTYGPPNVPPPAWTLGTQYSATVPVQVPGFGTMVPLGSWIAQAGYVNVAQINDMSTNTVVSGKTYAFTVNVGYNWIQLYFLVTGASTGSTVLPGFGLWNLGNNPGAWTYVTPEQFTGEWEIGLLSPESAAPVWLSIEYAPAKKYITDSPLLSKLIFSCTGGTVSYFSTSLADLPVADFPLQFPGGHRPVGMQHLFERSDPYILRNKEGEILCES